MPQEATDYSTSYTISPHLDHDLRTAGVRLGWFALFLGCGTVTVS
ncbi:hypothetical protein HMPREF9621_00563 [Cutibacterium modestum HL037PA2]|nr:hypothetical protein HMPREF9621_00563 [Cutibacterium modestum HL037PA2]